MNTPGRQNAIFYMSYYPLWYLAQYETQKGDLETDYFLLTSSIIEEAT